MNRQLERASSLAGKVYQHLHRALLRKELQPGDLLDRNAIARQVGASVSPVVQALGRLEREGFVEILPRRGTRVRTIRAEDFRASVLLRNALECQAIRITCGAPVREHRKRLLKLAQAVDRGVAGAPLNWEAEIAFHRALVELAQCPGFLSEYDHVMRLGLFVLVGTFSVESPFPPDPSGRWHADLIEHLQTDDPDAAERILRTHLEFGRQRFLRQAP